MTSFEQVTSGVTVAFSVTREQLHGHSRGPEVSRARFAAFHLCRTVCGGTLPEIGKHYGGKDPSSVQYGVRAAEGLMGEESFQRAYTAAAHIVREAEQGRVTGDTATAESVERAMDEALFVATGKTFTGYHLNQRKSA